MLFLKGSTYRNIIEAYSASLKGDKYTLLFTLQSKISVFKNKFLTLTRHNIQRYNKNQIPLYTSQQLYSN